MKENSSDLVILDGAIQAIHDVSQETLILSSQTQDSTLSFIDKIESYRSYHQKFS